MHGGKYNQLRDTLTIRKSNKRHISFRQDVEGVMSYTDADGVIVKVVITNFAKDRWLQNPRLEQLFTICGATKDIEIHNGIMGNHER